MVLDKKIILGALGIGAAALAIKAFSQGSGGSGGGGLNGSFSLRGQAAGMPSRRYVHEAGAIVFGNSSVPSATARWQGTVTNGGNAPVTFTPRLTVASGGVQANAYRGAPLTVLPGLSVPIDVATTISELATPGNITAHIGLLDSAGVELAAQDSGVLGSVQAVSPLTITGGFTPTSGTTTTTTPTAVSTGQLQVSTNPPTLGITIKVAPGQIALVGAYTGPLAASGLTDSNGKFNVVLPQGVYTVWGMGGIYDIWAPGTVSVPAGAIGTITLAGVLLPVIP